MTANEKRPAKSDFDKLSFEQALSRLNETVEGLEAGELPLSEATRLYETGMKLARICSEKLAEAELKITQIRTAYGEQMRLPPGDEAEE
jgi:exodeoxyribonuclease VII small subunit